MVNVHEAAIDWHADPCSGRRAPADVFAFDIDHRDEDHIGDVKVIWEKSRHQHLLALSISYALSGDEADAELVVSQIEDWISANPPLMGVNWSHPLELGIRLIAWVWCERLLRGSAARQRLIAAGSTFWLSVWWHQHVIDTSYSQGSSANNHLIGELCGLYCASCAWPVFDDSEDWRERSRTMLSEALVEQTDGDGINREMASDYQLFVLEFGVLALLAARDAGDAFPQAGRDTLAAMARATAELRIDGKDILRYGDGDEGMAIDLIDHGSERIDWLLEATAELTGTPNFARCASANAAITRCSNANYASADLSTSRAWSEAGLYLMRQPIDDAILTIAADAGPLGYLSIAAHGHADALSLTARIGDHPLLVDPGTYTYYGEAEWRAYFRSTIAHNTISVADQDQARQMGMFLWDRHNHTRIIKWQTRQDGCQLVAEQDGYRALGVIHERDWHLNEHTLTVTDRCLGNCAQRLAQHWHFHPDCSITGSGRRWTIRNGPASLNITLPIGANASLYIGGEHRQGPLAPDSIGPFLGWYSPRFKQRVACPTLRVPFDMALPARLTTTMGFCLADDAIDLSSQAKDYSCAEV